MSSSVAIDLITISRQFGAGGSELAHALGERLQWRVFDRELVHAVAERLELDDETVERLDERAPGLMRRLAAAMLLAPPEAPVAIDHEGMLEPDAIAAAATEAIRDVAASPPIIVVGHGGQAIFQNRPGTLHLRIVAPLADRIARVCQRFGCDNRVAAVEMQRTDDARRAYLRRYHHIDVGDPLLYDLQLNTGRVSIAECAEMLAALVTGRS